MSSQRKGPDYSDDTSFFANILQPGSSFHPTFLLIVDCAFLALLAVFVALVFLTSGNLHIFALITIELCLWGSVKWFVNELKDSPATRSKEDDRGDGSGVKAKKRISQRTH